MGFVGGGGLMVVIHGLKWLWIDCITSFSFDNVYECKGHLIIIETNWSREKTDIYIHIQI